MITFNGVDTSLRASKKRLGKHLQVNGFDGAETSEDLRRCDGWSSWGD